MRESQSLAALTTRILTGVAAVLDAENPDWVVVQGDTATAMAAALAAFFRKIPVCHVEAGLRSGNNLHPWPEEVNRKIIGGIAQLHCAPKKKSARALERENIDHAAIYITGNTGVDALIWVTDRLKRSPELIAGLADIEARLTGRHIIGVTAHRPENWGGGMYAIASAVRRIAKREDVGVIFPLHPNRDVRRIMISELSGLENVVLVEPLDYPHFARLMTICYFMLTDSGGVQEEAPTLGKPVLVMREATERAEGIEAGTAKLVGTDPDRIVAEAEKLLDDRGAYEAMARAHNPFGDGRASERILHLLMENRPYARN